MSKQNLCDYQCLKTMINWSLLEYFINISLLILIAVITRKISAWRFISLHLTQLKIYPVKVNGWQCRDLGLGTIWF